MQLIFATNVAKRVNKRQCWFVITAIKSAVTYIVFSHNWLRFPRIIGTVIIVYEILDYKQLYPQPRFDLTLKYLGSEAELLIEVEITKGETQINYDKQIKMLTHIFKEEEFTLEENK